MLLRKKYCFSMQVLNLFQDLFVSCLKVFAGVGTKDKPLVSEYSRIFYTVCVMGH